MWKKCFEAVRWKRHCSRYRESQGGRWAGWISDSTSTFNGICGCGMRLIRPTTNIPLKQGAQMNLRAFKKFS
jgi:hypothetical protein